MLPNHIYAFFFVEFPYQGMLSGNLVAVVVNASYTLYNDPEIHTAFNSLISLS